MFEKLKSGLKKKEKFFHKNISFLLKKFRVDITSLSFQTGVPVATIFRMKNKDNNPTISSVEPIANFFRVDIDDFLYEDLSSEAYQNKKKIGKLKYIPLVNLGDVKKIPLNFSGEIYCGAVGLLHDNSFAITVNSKSLEPIFSENSTLIIDPKIHPKDGDYVFCVLENDKLPVLRQIFIDGGSYFFKPININYGDMKCIKKFEIIGVIVKSIESYR